MNNYFSLPDEKLEFMMHYNKVPELGSEIGDSYITKMNHDDWLCSPLLERNADHMWETSIPANTRVYLTEKDSGVRAIFKGKQHFGDESRSIHDALQHLAAAIDSNRLQVIECKSLWPLIKRVNVAVGSLILAGRNFCVPGLHKEEAFGTRKWQWFSDCLETEYKFWAAIKAHEVASVMGSQCLLDAVEDVELDYTCGFTHINWQNMTMMGAGIFFSRPWLLGSAEAKKHWTIFGQYIRRWHQKASELDVNLVNTTSVRSTRKGLGNVSGEFREQEEAQQHFITLATNAFVAGRNKALENGHCSDCTASLGLVDC